ncbi:CitB Response regulator containing a CheY-like receiver domain and an HTH DNA-binding domain [Candidatus Nanopelagicaceae bacterium]
MRAPYILAISESDDFIDGVELSLKGIGKYSLQCSDSFRSALPRIRIEHYDCIIVDKNLGEGDGISLAPIINRINPECLTILVLPEGRWATIEAARSLGFSAILIRQMLEDQLPLVIKEKISPTIQSLDSKALSARQKLDRLSEREREILVDISQGKRNYEIASLRHISEGTIKSHLASIYRKLEVRNRVEAISMMKGF